MMKKQYYLYGYCFFPAESKVRQEEVAAEDGGAGAVVSVVLEKAGGGAGLGFGLDGGRDSPQGDRPLTIKKLFAGINANSYFLFIYLIGLLTVYIFYISV